MLVDRRGGVHVNPTDAAGSRSARIMTQPVSEPIKVIIPGKSFAELAPIANRRRVQVEMAVASNQAIFSMPGTRFVTRLIEGPFPDYRRVFPALTMKIVADRKELLAAVDRAASLPAKERLRCGCMSRRMS